MAQSPDVRQRLVATAMAFVGAWRDSVRVPRAPAGDAAQPAGIVGGLARDAMAGMVASFVTLVQCLSFSALIFSGDLAASLPMALWGFLVATAGVTLLCGLGTTLPPLLAGPRNPAVAVMGVLAATVSAAAFEAGLSAENAGRHVLVALAIASALTGLLIWTLGVLRLGQAVRFVPYPVIGGFLAASGLLLVIGGLEVGAGPRIGRDAAAAWLDDGVAARVLITAGFGAVLLGMRRSAMATQALPLVIVLAAVLVGIGVHLAGGAGAGGGMTGWYLAMGSGARGWSPLSLEPGLDWTILAGASVEILSIAGVSTAALLLDVSSLEVQRRTQADMDAEFRMSGAANLAIATVGGFPVGHALNPSRLVDALGGVGRGAGLAGGLFIAALIGSGIDFASLVPRPVLGGLLVFLGVGVLKEALKVPGRRSRPELALTLLIMAAIVGLGYLTGIMLGVVGACLLFAARYSRIDAVRRHVTRAEFAAPVERRSDVGRLLVEQGGRIHILWLTGFLFFGSSNGLFESIRRATAARGLFGRRWVVLDCSAVTGIDASAVLSFQKLANWAATADVVLVFAAARPQLKAELTAAGLLPVVSAAAPDAVGGVARAFETRSEALEWCEDELVRAARPGLAQSGAATFEGWLAREIGQANGDRLIASYLVRRELAAGEVVCALGAASDTIEMVAAGSVAVIVPGLGEHAIRVRRMTGGTVVGEMGFFRALPRAASVLAEEPSVVYVMTRESYLRLQVSEPDLCAAFLEFVVRALADRVDVANREIAALL